ncbi:PaaX family transcriptional regulator C-terminal domain-containing protein [uncultured Jatrophihabitans sp.]|uniref:PaaX family transcriptional regulator n=1 Tax=uncultured Jatrophihabitans sp. TaxID=1610747 RepID=UPI0035CB4A36
MSLVSSPTAPTISRRHAAGSDSARGQLFTVLGEFVLPSGGTAWTSSFIDIFARLGVEEKAIRQALMRTASDGFLVSERVGRRTRWTLTPSAHQLLVEGTERIYCFTGASSGWDGRWLLVLARTPETERPTRHLLRTRLTWAGLGSPAPGVWVSTHADRVPEVEIALVEAGLLSEAQVFVATHQGRGRLTELVRQAWDLEAIETAYEDFITRFSAPIAGDPLVSTVELVHAWRRFPWIDPLLPDELLPAPWSGVTAASLFARRHADWAADARAAWQALET